MSENEPFVVHNLFANYVAANIHLQIKRVAPSQV